MNTEFNVISNNQSGGITVGQINLGVSTINFDDNNIVVSILTVIKTRCDGYDLKQICENSYQKFFNFQENEDPGWLKLAHYIKLLSNRGSGAGYIDGDVKEVSCGRLLPDEIQIYGLTKQGYDLLSAFRHDPMR